VRGLTIRFRYATLLCSTALVAAVSTPALAQNADAPTPPAAQNQSGAQLQEIIVTAQRRGEALSKVPVAVSAFGGDVLRQRVVTREQDLSSLVPGLIVKNGQNSNQLSFTMRGQTLDPFSGTSPAVLTYINEAPFIGGNTSTSIFDLSSLQVLKGPQGTLFGRNATGGAVLYETTKPGDEFGGYITLRGGQRAMFQAQGAVDIPIVKDRLLVRLAGDYTRSDGYIKNVNTGSTLGDTNAKSGRITIVARPTDNLENILVGQYSKFGGTEGSGGLFSYHSCGETNNGFALTTTMDCVYGSNSPFAPTLGNGPPGPGTWPGATAGYLAWQQQNPYKVWLSYDLPHSAHSSFITNTTKLDLPSNLTVKNIFSWGDSFARTPGILTGSPFGAIDLFNFTGLGNGPPGGETFDTRRWSDELQLQGKALDDRLQFIAGLFYDHKRQTDYIPVVVGPELFPTPLADIAYFYTDRDTSRAVFGQASYKVTDALTVTLGGRYTWESLKLNQNPGSLFTLPGMPPAPRQSKKLSAPSWTFNVSYQLNPDSMVYFAQRGSFRSGNFNGPVVPYNDLNFFKNEYAKDVELGYKFSGRLAGVPTHFNVAVYQQNVKNAQHAVYALVAGNPAGFTVNVPKKRVRGVEVDGDLHPTGWLKVGISGAYTEGKYTDNIVDLSQQTGIAGYKVPFDSYPDTPKWAGSVYADVTLPTPADLGEVVLHGDLFGQSSSYFSSNAGTITPRTHLSGYAVANLRVSWNEVMRSRASVAVYVRNLFDKVYYQSGYVEGASGGFNTALWGEPRTVGVELSSKF